MGNTSSNHSRRTKHRNRRRTRRRKQRGGMVKPSQKTAPDDRGYGRGFTRAVHQKDGQVQMGTQLAGSSGGTGASKGGGRRRRRHRGKDFDKHLKRVIAQHRRYQIARGDKRFKATRGLVKWSRPNKTKRANRVYYRKRKSRRRRRRKGGGIGASRMTGVSNMQVIAQQRAQIHDAAAREIQQELGNMGLKVTLAEAKKELKRFSGIQGQATHAYKALISKCCQSCRN